MENTLLPFDWNHVRAFLATAEEGSLSAAARKLRLTQPTLGRQVAALEDELGLMLFERVGRSLILTRAGTELLEHVRAMGDAASRVALVASGQSQAIDGLIRITASDIFSAFVLPPALKQLQLQAPRLQVDIVATNDISDLMRREADVAIRNLRPEQPDLIARLVREASAYFYASTEYLDRMGRPQSLDDLADHDFIHFGDAERMCEYLTPLGLPVTTDNFRIGSGSALVGWELSRQGFGIATMDEAVARLVPGMEKILPELEPVVFPVWLATHRELHTSRRIRLVFDLLADFLSKSSEIRP
ncbi:D-malate degradation protein R [Thalassovita gelatinovora]|uniref:D-malate degradation protein R n=1 Tax=Thalassovita gelatinovora TaxID=53501 RepID=A0A0P1FYU7_THAGE|nr:LysR family transcriptional regulator [Thalassovita gelatinovora]QIZ80423.1 LysR family transcriptional regulator [Thalassovita gelatinovora]CUH65805.1 D-malate degradation protein R [Thalassovita gelatinovora]SEQ72131.1 transcriptional regulator, LysR family [Thalassovita gelatinovora]